MSDQMDSPGKQMVMEFLSAFCEGRFDDLAHLLAEDFHFEGPLLNTDSRSAYLAALKAEPHQAVSFEVLHMIEEQGVVCAVYRFEEGPLQYPLVQVFLFAAGYITKSMLVFDTRQAV